MADIYLFFKALYLWITGEIPWGRVPTDTDVDRIAVALEECEIIAYREEERGEIVPDAEKQKTLDKLKYELRYYGLRTPIVSVVFWQLVMDIEMEMFGTIVA